MGAGSPTLAIEVTAQAVRTLRGGAGWGRPGRCLYAERRLPPGVVVPSPSAPNVRDEAAFGSVVTEALGPGPPRRARLVLPDRSLRLYAIECDGPPAAAALRPFLTWRLQDALPFPAREARLAYAMGANGMPGRQLAVTAVGRETVLGQYERVLGDLGVPVGHVAPAAVHLFNLARVGADPGGDAVEALLAVAPDTATLCLARGGVPHYVRTFALGRLNALDGAGEPPEAPEAAGHRPPFCSELAEELLCKELAEELLRSFDHAADTAGLPAPARLCVGGEIGPYPGLPTVLAEILDAPCSALSPPLRSRDDSPLPPEAAALAAALAHP